MKMPKIVLLSALVSCALLSGCKDDKASQVTIEFMHSSVEQERQAVITKLIEKFEKENPTITVKQVPVEEDAYNTKVITLARTGALPEVIEVSHDYAKVMDKEQLLDRDAIGNAIKAVGEDTFYDGILRVVRTEDGKAWTGVPVSAWLSGVWYHKDALAAAGIEEPHNWEQLLKASQALNDPAKKHYGIALPTAESVMTEQAFSQFALSGGANVFDANGNVKIDTPEMSKALAFYRALAANTMPGSNDVMEIKDAFMNGSAPMAVYSTYIVFSRACSEPNPDYPRWSRKRIEETCWELLMNGYLNCEDLIDPVVTFTTSPESYMKYVDQHPELSIKMGVTF